MQTKNVLFTILILGAGLFLGDQLFLQKREIASVVGTVKSNVGKSYYDLTELSADEFSVGFKSALISGLAVEKNAGLLDVSWGQFQIKNESGGKVFACEKYPVIEMELKAEGVAHSGELPTLVVRGPCRTSDDGKKILPFPIPLQNLAESLIANPVLKFPTGAGSDEFTITADNLFKPIPRYWNVTNVKLSNETESLSMDGYEIISLLDQALTLDFAP